MSIASTTKGRCLSCTEDTQFPWLELEPRNSLVPLTNGAQCSGHRMLRKSRGEVSGCEHAMCSEWESGGYQRGQAGGLGSQRQGHRALSPKGTHRRPLLVRSNW